ncbi:diuretic hormone receptor-like [Anneissia japonica]|uniref:diuretic hormone receptor-like n=1 Tax=Anneissia japonica TaxID=1529436 RepID=UPI0014254F5C|nr:diuretic hormone receptor-like [Anneissia japonica]
MVDAEQYHCSKTKMVERGMKPVRISSASKRLCHVVMLTVLHLFSSVCLALSNFFTKRKCKMSVEDGMMSNSVDERSLILENECLDKYIDQQNKFASTGEPFCPTRFDCFMCWPPTPANQTAFTSCPPEVDARFELSGGTADNFCGAYGNWTEITYSDCEHILTSNTVCRCHHCDALQYIMLVGYSVSLIALVVAFFMIVGIRALRVKRNKIHANLLASFICLYTLTLFSLILYFFVDQQTDRQYIRECITSIGRGKEKSDMKKEYNVVYFQTNK